MTVDAMEKLKDRGWYVTEHGYTVGSNSGDIKDVDEIIRRLKDIDLREVGSGQGDIAQGNVVLQIQKIRNIAAPKHNEESRSAPRMLKLSLTDGKNNFQAIEIDHISGLSLNTPPGTKILIKSGTVPMSHGMILLVKASEMIHVIGGSVSNLVEKWELNKKLQFHTRVRPTEEGGPPPWIPFGKKIIKVLEHDKNFKALAEKEKSSKENAVFEAQRKDAIAEAARQGSKKVFGGGTKQLLDHSVQKIIDQGFSIEQAEYALKVNKNNVDRALKSLTKSNRGPDTKKLEKHGPGKESREPRNKRSDKKSEESKPSSGKISLFDFLEDKLPVQSEPVETSNSFQSNHAQNAENFYDKVDLKNSDTHGGKRGSRPQRGARGYQAPPRHQEENKTNKRVSSTQYTQYNGGNSAQQSKPPRFQRNQETHNYYQQDAGSKTYQKSQSAEYRNSNPQPRTDSTVTEGAHYQKGQDQQGKSLNASKSYNQVETDAQSRHAYDASYGRHNRAQQEGAYRAYPASTNDKNYKNQMNRYQPNDNSGGRGAIGPKSQRNENHYSNNQCANPAQAGSTWVWRIGDKCLAKSWEDNTYYSAEVTDIADRTCIVRFDQFKNYQEVLHTDCIPFTAEYQVSQDNVDPRRSDPQRYNNRQQAYYDQGYNHISGMEFRRSGSGPPIANRGYGRRRGQQRSSQPIYQPPAQRNQNSMPMNTQNNSLL